ncbi:hypothetical protein BV898_13189 [Hypsibius exemplaris]|uniref:Uncharacterized protein n=1 Tax=Hypsibius exemplaris TaxID=2072580 RepID=A0A1W0WBF1_HYPEX|nr:hypothetical protein BV898_13189 [Hypsibius exemplaris]
MAKWTHSRTDEQTLQQNHHSSVARLVHPTIRISSLIHWIEDSFTDLGLPIRLDSLFGYLASEPIPKLLGTNQCGPMVVSYRAEIVDDGRPDKVIFVKAQPQRDWLSWMIKTEAFSPCPKRRDSKPQEEFTANKVDIFLTANEAAQIETSKY